ncbi:MAG: ABC transporter ATP-binding protein [Granulosicoccus sp.]
MTTTVEINQVSHQFGEFQALSDINLSIPAGSFAVLLGPSGCGKTTLLSILGGFLTPASGVIQLDGKDITHVPPSRRTTTTMFQDYALFPHMSLLDNVGFGLRMRGQNKSTRNTHARKLLGLVGLESSADQKPHQLSGGQRQRVALARALAVEPDVLLLDEPLGALDLKLRRQMQDELKSIQKRVGTTFIHVTHDQEEAMAIADQIIVMNGGRVEDTGTPESIYLQPKTVFSAAFMGEANQISGSVVARDKSEMTLNTSLGELIVPASSDVNQNINTGDAICLCFRPEHLVDNHDSATGLLNIGQARVVDHAFFGTHQRCKLATDNGVSYTANFAQSVPIKNDQRLSIGLKKQYVVTLLSKK